MRSAVWPQVEYNSSDEPQVNKLTLKCDALFCAVAVIKKEERISKNDKLIFFTKLFLERYSSFVF